MSHATGKRSLIRFARTQASGILAVPMPTKPRAQLTLHDPLSRLNLIQANKLLGPAAAALLPKAGREEIDIAAQVLFTADQFQVVYPLKQVVVTLALHPSYRDRLQIACSHEGETADSQLAPSTNAPAPETIQAMQTSLTECAQPNEDGTLNLTLKLPDAESLKTMATALAKLLAG